MSSNKMQYKKLGHSGLKVSELCLGAMNFGWTAVGGTTEHDAFKILDRFAELGGNFIDTADAYENGESERIIGKWLQKQKRQQFIIATKAYFPMGSCPNDAGLSRKHLIEALEGSLQRLQTTYIDLYQLHNWDKEVPIEETLVTLNDLVRSGKVRYIGVSNFRGYQLIIASEICNKLNLAKFICLQPQYNLLCREPEWEILASAQHLGLGIIPWSPLRGGWLSGKWTRKSQKPEGSTEGRLAWQEKSKFPDNSWEVNANEQTWSIIDTLEAIAKKHSKSVSQVAIRWVMQRPGVTAPIVGPRNLTQAEDNFGVVGWELTKEEMDELNNVSTPKVPYPYNFF